MQVSICELPLYNSGLWSCHAKRIHAGLLNLLASRSRRKGGLEGEDGCLPSFYSSACCSGCDLCVFPLKFCKMPY